VIALGRRRAGGTDNRRARGAHNRRARVAHKIKADINVTPLVDVVLVLLIIFMVVTPMLNKGVNVELPLTLHHDKRIDDSRDIVVAITREGQLYVGSERVSIERLATAVVSERRRYPDKSIFLKGDTRISYGQAHQAMQALHQAGIDQVELGTEEVRQP
jgi:biopolymer transport protein ExbD